MGDKVKKIISNRKISIYIDESDFDLKKDYYTTLNDWFYHARRYANDVANILQCATVMNNINKTIEGDLSVKLHEYIETSSQNLNYKLLSQKYKPLLPSIFRASIGNNIYKTYSKNIGEILKGNKTVSTYNVGFPLYFNKNKSFKFESSDKNNFTFNLLGIPFKTKLGRDRSNNEEIINRIISGEYKMSDSSLKKDGKDLYLLLTFSLPKKQKSLDKDMVVGVDLGINTPAYVSVNGNSKSKMSIGSREGFLNQRLSIQTQRRSLQSSLQYTKGGKGRNKKLNKLESIKDRERNFVKNTNHKYSRDIINFALQNGCGTINIENIKGIGREDKNSFILRNWSYHELQSMITYKADREGIIVNVIDPRYSSQRCHSCGHIDEENRKTQSEFECVSCGNKQNADYNASKNISIAHTKSYISEIESHKKKMDKEKTKKESENI
jgi:IS605 OrfB family transposase